MHAALYVLTVAGIEHKKPVVFYVHGCTSACTPPVSAYHLSCRLAYRTGVLTLVRNFIVAAAKQDLPAFLRVHQGADACPIVINLGFDGRTPPGRDSAEQYNIKILCHNGVPGGQMAAHITLGIGFHKEVHDKLRQALPNVLAWLMKPGSPDEYIGMVDVDIDGTKLWFELEVILSADLKAIKEAAGVVAGSLYPGPVCLTARDDLLLERCCRTRADEAHLPQRQPDHELLANALERMQTRLKVRISSLAAPGMHHINIQRMGLLPCVRAHPLSLQRRCVCRYKCVFLW